MIFRNHNACRDGIRTLLNPDTIIRNGYYVSSLSGEVLEFSVVYAPRNGETIDSIEFVKIIESDLRSDKILYNPYRLDLIKMEDIGNLSQKLVFKVIDPYFFDLKLRKDSHMKNYIHEKLSLIRSIVFSGDAMIDPQRNNRIVVEGDSVLVTAVQRISVGSVSACSKNVYESMRKFVAEWIENENLTMEGWEYVVEVDSEENDTVCVVRVFARACC